MCEQIVNISKKSEIFFQKLVDKVQKNGIIVVKKAIQKEIFKKMTIIQIPTNKVIPYEKNPRKNDPAVEAVANSIRQFGFKVPVIIDKNNVIVCGHTRVKAAKKLGLDTVPCIVADDLSEEQIRAFRLADNKVSELAEWDFTMLDEELELIKDIDMEQFGFEKKAATPEDVKEDDYDPTDILQEDPKSKPGEMYKLGDHILIVGDSTQTEDVDRLMGEDKADLVVTDPPYNVNVTNSKGMKIQNDNMAKQEFHDFLVKCFKNLADHLKNGGSFYVWLASSEWINFETALNENNLKVRQELIWNKNSANLSRSDYHWKHEPCMYGWKEGAAHYFIDEYTHTSVFEDKKEEYSKMKKEELLKIIEEMLQPKDFTTVIDEKKPVANDLHPTMKPLKLISRLVNNSSRPGEIVLDLFGGSGSTLIVCEQMGRKCRMVEYDPRYADAIIDRWEKYTGRKAERL